MDYEIKIALITLVISCIITTVIMPFFIPILHKLKFGQSIREDGPKSHLSKQGTPTMGGIVFVLATILTMLLFRKDYFFSNHGLAITIVFIGFFLIGLLDDLLIVIKKQNDGVSPKAKLLLQALVTIVLIIVYPELFSSNEMTSVNFFFFDINMHQLYVVFALIMFMAYSNAINFTDGLDGLSSITVAIALAFMAIIAYVQSQAVELVYIGALIGGLLGFYIFNKKPARVFMGDTGSLALGGFYAVIALLLKVELLSIIIGMVFVLEAVSVVIQILYYKKTKKRFFRMAPLHHHFEMSNLKESGTVLLFYAFGFVFGVLGMVIYFV
ncbi:phospho-N-acetylmuramoyl-pentapeptide-transferase [Bacilli bacterium PM5-3]|nr:phospho-N-acetylmuramoyl-pentapeptide-transferase [Bacilli bacterium PM5-3]MDH6603234.1 phospho-N-acetylmuramoyl-pentapeptide-transferase [Bacilli bacterium PM5-9]